MLDLSALDAFIAGLSTAFFGALVAGGAYLLRQQLILREQIATLRLHVSRLQALEGFVTSASPTTEILKAPLAHKGSDADGA